MGLHMTSSIRKKILLLLSGVVTVGVLAASAIFYRQVIATYNDSYHRDLTVRASIIGANCTAALTFSLPDDANTVLASLKSDPSIIAARIHDSSGKVFACFGDDCQDGLPAKQAITITEKITLDGRVLGDVELVDDMRHVREFQKKGILSLGGILVGVLICCTFLARYLCTLITKPLQELAALAVTIATEQDYTHRATVHCHDEVGIMADAFNTMMERIDRNNRELITSERRFRTLVNQGVDAFFLHDDKGHFVDVNQAACDSLGYSREGLLSLTVADVDGESFPRQDQEKIWQQLTPGEAVTITSYHKRRDGSLFPVEVRVGLLEMDGRRYIMGLTRDISERLAEAEARRAIEVQLQQAQKMESIGNLAGGIAHDFNNILSAVIGFTDLAMMQTSHDNAIQENLRQVRTAADRATALVKQILTFSRKQQQEKLPLQVSLVVKEALKLLRASIPSTIEIRQDIAAQGTALADPTQIHQVIMNLCTNAYHAMLERGGVLAVTLKESIIRQPLVDCGTELPSGQYLKLSVSDSGSGMNKETLARIFEPYFTTKEKGRGTGLGLAVVHGIVKDHHGRISVYSEPGHGTTFNVYLPMIAQEQATTSQIIVLPPMSKNHERIMVVDDEAPIRDMTNQFLTQAGYRVDLFTNGAEAWAALSQTPNAWHLLLTDQTMPGMTGAQLITKAHELRPDLPAIICSGFSETLDDSHAHNLGVKAFLQKPVGVFTLLSAVNEALCREKP